MSEFTLLIKVVDDKNKIVHTDQQFFDTFEEANAAREFYKDHQSNKRVIMRIRELEEQ